MSGKGIRFSVVLVAFNLAMMVAACGSSRDQADRVGGGAAVGAGSGAAIGAVFGGIGALPGAVIGAAVGGTTGAVTNESEINLGEPVWKD